MCLQNRKGLILFYMFMRYDAFLVEVMGVGDQIGTTLEILDGKINRIECNIAIWIEEIERVAD